jgi:hypothetical protein
MRRSGRKFPDRIQSVVMGVYNDALTLSGESASATAAHLVHLPQRLTAQR